MFSRICRHLNAGQATCDVTVTSLLILLLSSFFVCSSAQDNLQPANPHASAEARKVLDYLQSIQGKEMLAGHHVELVYNLAQPMDTQE